MWKILRPKLRKIYRMLLTFNYFIYDFKRYFKYGGYTSNFEDDEIRNYNLAMVYHGLEKSLSYKNRNQNSGWTKVHQILDLLEFAKINKTFNYHDIAAIQVLEKFIELPSNIDDKRSFLIKNELLQYKEYSSEDIHGSKNHSINDFLKGKLNNPEDFFYSRYSLREFKDTIVDTALIEKAVKLSMKSPSVCNRQAWGIYHTNESKVKKEILRLQNGNKPFGEKIPNLILITTDLKAFFSAEEHYQHWIDGGLFSMSLMYAFHSLGIATCALNWSAKPSNDIELRENINIKDNHTVIMVLAVGYPDESNLVCESRRRPINEVFFNLELK